MCQLCFSNDKQMCICSFKIHSCILLCPLSLRPLRLKLWKSIIILYETSTDLSGRSGICCAPWMTVVVCGYSPFANHFCLLNLYIFLGFNLFMGNEREIVCVLFVNHGKWKSFQIILRS